MTDTPKATPSQLAMRGFVKALNGKMESLSKIAETRHKGKPDEESHPLIGEHVDKRRITIQMTWDKDQINLVANHFLDMLESKQNIEASMTTDKYTQWSKLQGGDTISFTYTQAITKTPKVSITSEVLKANEYVKTATAKKTPMAEIAKRVAEILRVEN